MEVHSLQSVLSKLGKWLTDSEKPLLVVCGATGSGKSDLAVDLAQQFGGEVINADSRQIYQEIYIGNALTTREQQRGVPHHLLSYSPLQQTLSVSEYKGLAEGMIDELQGRRSLPILCGGSVMWIDAVVDNYVIPQVPPNSELRDRLGLLSIDELLGQLEQRDPASHEQLKNCSNRRYIIRALEIFEQTGKPKSELAKRGKRKYEVFKVAPHWERQQLYDRINRRAEEQVRAGLVEEVQGIIDRHAGADPHQLLTLNWPSLSSIGCKEVIPFLLGQQPNDAMLEHVKQANRNYAKRQLSWLRRDPEIHWVAMPPASA
ncbi:MAG: tRNA (adenosine(37)-N6)-dimethylallyltransferase MiaA [bacterium]|nr:tRNA (adenosine(37)-N6)-dimethylallyltransferase MiaA [bacterium]